MTLIKDGAVSRDSWVHLDDGETINGAPAIIVSYDRWHGQRAEFTAHNGPLGIRMRSDQPPSLIEEHVGRFDLIALEFPSLNDGRGFSHARILRERFGFAGELRAVGDVIEDQIFFMARSGFNAFELADGREPAHAIAALKEFSVAYQPAADHMAPAYELRRRMHSNRRGA
ncbi:MAG: DUF934 domain-containing protein [Rhodospirillales bacterium]|nr:DUF934 domain-containing protein [Rhodospirillales bacterium]